MPCTISGERFLVIPHSRIALLDIRCRVILHVLQLLREAIVVAEKSLDEPKKLNALLKDEQALIGRLKALHVSQSALQEENQVRSAFMGCRLIFMQLSCS